MSIEYMRAEIIKKYGPFMRGKKVEQMSDSQVLAIYNRMINSKR